MQEQDNVPTVELKIPAPRPRRLPRPLNERQAKLLRQVMKHAPGYISDEMIHGLAFVLANGNSRQKGVVSRMLKDCIIDSRWRRGKTVTL